MPPDRAHPLVQHSDALPQVRQERRSIRFLRLRHPRMVADRWSRREHRASGWKRMGCKVRHGRHDVDAKSDGRGIVP